VLYKVKFEIRKWKGEGPYGLNEAVCHEDIWGVLTSAVDGGDGGEWSASRHSRFTLQGKSTGRPFDRGVAGPQTQSRRCWVEKNLRDVLGIEFRPFSLWPVTVPGWASIRNKLCSSCRYLGSVLNKTGTSHDWLIAGRTWGSTAECRLQQRRLDSNISHQRYV
jgi:hypothetical protein